MAQFRRGAHFVDAWRIPLWGHAAAEPLPDWMVSRLLDESLEINHLGGFTIRSGEGVDVCAAGDVIVMTNNTIAFLSFDRFERRYQPVH